MLHTVFVRLNIAAFYQIVSVSAASFIRESRFFQNYNS